MVIISLINLETTFYTYQSLEIFIPDNAHADPSDDLCLFTRQQTPTTPTAQTTGDEPQKVPTMTQASADSESLEVESTPATITPLPTGAPLPAKDEIEEILDILIVGEADAIEATVNRVVASADQRFIPVFMELLRAVQIRIRPASHFTFTRGPSGRSVVKISAATSLPGLNGTAAQTWNPLPDLPVGKGDC